MHPHSHPFDPTYGYSVAQLLDLKPPAAPDDFEAFWGATYAQARATPLRVAHRPVASPWTQLDLWEVEFDSLDGVRIGGWITKPHNQPVHRGVVMSHGYGGRAAADPQVFGPAVAIFPCARGFNRSRHPTIPGQSGEHVLHGLASRETYVHRGCAADIWAAVRVLLELFPETETALDYIGMSFGGGIGAMALPWEPRFRRAFLDVPSFGNNPIRLTLPCVGSGQSLRTRLESEPEAVEVLRYFDSAIHATRIGIPTFVAAAQFDPAVPPPAQFSVYNALAGPKKLFVREVAHFAWDGTGAENKRLAAELCEWFK
jgi:cephalosporin-C deacetylase